MKWLVIALAVLAAVGANGAETRPENWWGLSARSIGLHQQY